MISRIALILVTAFWAIMNILLWRAEYGQRGSAGSSVPAEVVWRKILTAPDSSSLTIFHHGKKIGFCHWITSVGEELSQIQEDTGSPEGMVRRIMGYRLQLEGNVSSEKAGNRIRFESALTLTTNQLWQDFNLRIILRPTVLEIHSSAIEQRVRFHVDDGEEKFERVMKFSELQNPQSILREFGGPIAAGLLSSFGMFETQLQSSALKAGLKWEGREDSMRIGHSPVRTYRLQAHLLDRYKITIFVSRVGEILRVELPDEIVLVNDQLSAF
jgi:hypothetical protein